MWVYLLWEKKYGVDDDHLCGVFQSTRVAQIAAEEMMGSDYPLRWGDTTEGVILYANDLPMFYIQEKRVIS